jgi:transcriptional regulator with XRE-family HTH domain
MQRGQQTRSPDPRDREVGQRIRAQRLIRKMSQEELGDRIGITFQQVQKYEKGTNRVSAGRLIRISEILGVPVSFFLEGDRSTGGSADQINSALSFLKTAGAVRLLRAYNQIGGSEVRKALVELAERVASRESRLVSPRRGRRARN